MTREPGFTSVAVVTLALGIGVNTTMFSIANAVLLRPLPFPAADKLAAIHEWRPRTGEDVVVVSYATFLDVRDAAQSFERLAAMRLTEVILRRDDDALRRGEVFASPELFDVLGVHPAFGARTQIRITIFSNPLPSSGPR